MTGATSSNPSGVLLTVDDVRAWKREIREISATIERLQARGEELGRKLNAAALFLDVESVVDDTGDLRQNVATAAADAPAPDEVESAAPARVVHRRRSADGPTWIEVVLEGVKGSEMGLTYAEMRAIAAASPLGPKLEKSDKGYHNAISRLARDKVIVREHGRLFTPEAYKKFTEAVTAGEASTVVPQTMPHSPMGEAILRIVADKPAQLNGKGVISELRKDPEHNATLTPHETGAYNIIARLVKREQILRRDDGLLIPGPNFPGDLGEHSPKRDGALHGHAASAPTAGGAATPPTDIQSVLRLIG